MRQNTRKKPVIDQSMCIYIYMYTDACDIAIGANLAQKVQCTPMVSTAVRQMMKLGVM